MEKGNDRSGKLLTISSISLGVIVTFSNVILDTAGTSVRVGNIGGSFGKKLSRYYFFLKQTMLIEEEEKAEFTGCQSSLMRVF